MAGPSGSQHGSQGSDEKSEGDLLEPEEESPDRLAVKSALENVSIESPKIENSDCAYLSLFQI